MMKVAIVSGAGGNLGKEVANKLLENDYRVFGTLSPREKPDTSRGDLILKNVDLSVETESGEFVNEILLEQKQIDVAVLTVGGYSAGDLTSTSILNVQQQIRLNFETAYNLVRPIFLQMLKQGSGRVFLVGSRASLDMSSGKKMLAYSLSKSLIFHLAELLNEEAKGTEVVTTVLVPGTIDTPENRAAMPSADKSHWVAASDIAETILFLCSGTAKAISNTMVNFFHND